MIPHRPIFAHIRDNNNLGDMLCGAHGLFPEYRSCENLDFRAVTSGPEPLIVGGGGMIHPGIDKWIQTNAMIRPVFLVGVGVNYHNEADAKGWEWKIRPCLEAGIRDKKISLGHDRFEYCPCPTTGLIDWESLRSDATHREPMLIFQHYDHPIFDRFDPKLPRHTNRWDQYVRLEVVARALGRFERVLTNTYHGALWSARMGCEVVLWKPFSSRFRTGLPFSCPSAHRFSDVEAAFDVWADPKYRADVDSALLADYDHLNAFTKLIRTTLQ